ncbi:MAG: PLP-dependent transferase [Rhodocyclaceae bacterium]|nr:PLP-dependent transferase [Rhodocyclaceae bacterium]
MRPGIIRTIARRRPNCGSRLGIATRAIHHGHDAYAGDGALTRPESLGDRQGVAQHPASMSRSTDTPGERRAHPIDTGLDRIPAGLEDTDDLLAGVARRQQASPAGAAVQPRNIR